SVDLPRCSFGKRALYLRRRTRRSPAAVFDFRSAQQFQNTAKLLDRRWLGKPGPDAERKRSFVGVLAGYAGGERDRDVRANCMHLFCDVKAREKWHCHV